MIRDFTSFAVMAVFLYAVGLVLFAAGQTYQPNRSAIVAATERN